MKSNLATKEIRERIMRNVYEPGTHLQEHMLVEELGVSRTPIRSALTTLHKEGLLNYVPKCGYFVHSASANEVFQAWAFRGALEGFACKIVASGEADSELRTTLADCLNAGDEILRRDDINTAGICAYRSMNAAFHGAIVEAADNIFLKEAMERFRNIPVYVQMMDNYYERESANPDELIVWLRRMHDDHHRIADALFSREPQRAEALIIEHHHYSSKYISNRMS
ncbi:MAG: GntR family transcriptional regulator [Flavobacteriaceae bacterium]